MRALTTLAAFALVAFAPPSPAEWQWRGDAAWAAGDPDSAATFYRAAGERSADPGLVAFNLGVVALQEGDARTAELHFRAALSDTEAPAVRVRRAEYNLGLALLTRGGTSAVYAEAVAANERCLALSHAPDTLRADATHNLELAKLFFAASAAREQAAPPSPPGDPPPESSPPDSATASSQVARDVGNPGSPSGSPPESSPHRPRETGARAPGPAALPSPPDDEDLPPLSPEDARAVLRVQGARLARERDARDDRAPERGGTHALDW